KHVHARGEFHRGLTAHHVGLDPGVTVAHQDDGGRIARRYGLAGPDRILAHGCGNRHSHHWTSTMSSTSTGASIGNTATPTALRAGSPASPKASPSSSLAPLATCGCAVKAGSLATNTTAFTTRVTRSRSVTACLTAATAFSAAMRAHCPACSGDTVPPP